MSEPLNKLANEAQCFCKNNVAIRFRRLYDRGENELLGLQCKICCREYLKETFFVLVDPKGHVLQPGKQRFYLAERFRIPEGDAHMVRSARTKIKNVMSFGDYLKPGDHIAWHRTLGHWHHAIVTEISSNEGNMGGIRVIHWYSNIGKNPECKIQEQWIKLQEQQGSLYRMDYPEQIVKANPPRLVIARARSRIAEKGYDLIKDNCETFASFCKFGVAISQQILWACREIKNECKKSGLATAAKVGIAEFIEQVFSKQDQSVGFCLVVIIESMHTYVDIEDIWKARKDGKMTRKVAIEQITERLTQAVFGGGLAGIGGMTGSIGGAFSGPILGFIFGFCGGIVGKWFGSMTGPHLGQFITNLIEYDDRAICQITDLRSGDHLVLEYGSELSHHCIVQYYYEEKNLINIIHNTEKDGIIDEYIDFVQPVYKVIYGEKDGHNPEDVWKKAYSMIGRKRYDSETFNSKHFAQLCSKKQ